MFVSRNLGDNNKMALQEDLQNALVELRKEKTRKFDQTVDLVLNLQKFQIKKEQVNIVVGVPHPIKEKKVCGFLEVSNKSIDTIGPESFGKYSDKKAIKKLVEKYDFFIAEAKIMPKVATVFGRALGPSGKMPSPQLGILMNNDEKTLKELLTKINSSVKLKTKEASIKLAIGRQSMKDEEIVENALAIYNATEKALVRGKENIKNVEIKFTMTKPVKIKLR
jgi:large subunit ribosomal protein L1